MHPCESDHTVRAPCTTRPRRLRPFRRSEVLHRFLYSIEHDGRTYTVDVDTGRDVRTGLYRDGERQAKADLPATFPVPGGAIEVDLTLYGVRRAHLVLDSGAERRLVPTRGTAEELRGRLTSRHPAVSRTIAGTAIVILLVNLVLAVPQGLAMLTRIPFVAEHVGVFTSPIALPGWLTTTLLIAGVAAAMERALTLRRNRILDLETLWSGL